MIYIYLLMDTEFETHYNSYRYFPFENLKFILKYELSPIVDGNKTYRFQYFVQMQNAVEWKQNSDYISNFDLNFKNSDSEFK